MTRRDDPFDDDRFDDIFEEMFEQMNEMMENMGAQGFGGFRMTGGPDGADFESFGDENPFAGAGGFEGARSNTHVDVLDEGAEVRIVADLPGVEKDDIRVAVSGESLKIQASGEEREYDERVSLPAEVDDDTGEATYNNGVLEIVFDKVDDTENDKEIEIE
ncbi:MAG: Hsp20/alpha crystallin family protein [Halobacteriales archaeon]